MHCFFPLPRLNKEMKFPKNWVKEGPTGIPKEGETKIFRWDNFFHFHFLTSYLSLFLWSSLRKLVLKEVVVTGTFKRGWYHADLPVFFLKFKTCNCL